MVKKLISEYFEIEVGKVIVEILLVGGGYGGKVVVQLELFVYLVLKVVGGRLVKILNIREEDMFILFVYVGLDVKIKLGCFKEGFLQVVDIFYLFDSGVYVDKGMDLSKVVVVDCMGFYCFEYVFCDLLCVYINYFYVFFF